MKKLLLGLAATSVLLSGCAKEQASFDIQDQNQKVAKNNAKFNAQAFLLSRPDLKGFSMVPEGDSTISGACPQGDGWATIKLWHEEGGKYGPTLKCSTFSKERSCLLKKDFKNKSYSAEDGQCQKGLKSPIKSVMG